MPPPPVRGGRRLRLQSPQYTGRSDIGSNGSSSIAFPQSAHFRSRCRTSTIRLSPKPIRSPFCSLGPSSTDCRRRSLQTDTVPQSSAKGKTASPRALRDARRPAAQPCAHSMPCGHRSTRVRPSTMTYAASLSRSSSVRAVGSSTRVHRRRRYSPDGRPPMRRSGCGAESWIAFLSLWPRRLLHAPLPRWGLFGLR